jgi:hypothetical protein
MAVALDGCLFEVSKKCLESGQLRNAITSETLIYLKGWEDSTQFFAEFSSGYSIAVNQLSSR